jgi:hypothetical protein
MTRIDDKDGPLDAVLVLAIVLLALAGAALAITSR